MSSSNDDDSGSDNSAHQRREQSATVIAPVHSDLWPNEDPDVMRILISTDNHLGYAERDAVRGMDSFAAFEEVLYLAKKFNCDMVLIAGDLFHDNRPSRRTLHKTMEILRRYCMGPEPVKIEFLSDAATQLRSALTVNYQDANYSVGLPLFSIHGNHDDPSRDQGGGELLAALDLLAMSNLVNYFGRQDQVDKIEISPLLLQKGSTKIALYGLGSLRDERLNRMWEQKKVRFLRPAPDDDEEDDEEEEDFFNIFTLHQNRDLGRGSKNCVQESMIPEWMDIVVWGHEHECLIEFVESVVGTFRITQPGSSVATSLVAGEAQTKKVGVLDIRGKNFRLHPVPLTQVRSFVTVELSLRQHRSELDPDDPKIDSKVSSVLEDEVRYIANSAREKHETLLNDARRAGNDAAEEGSTIKYKLEKPNEVLVRIRVEHSGFSSLNNQRFGAKFVGDVANPSDMLLFHRKKDPNLASKVKKKKIQPMAPEEIEQTNMEDLIKQQLEAGDGKMHIFGHDSLSEAMDDYVEKSVTAAITDVAVGILLQKTKALIAMSHANDEVVDEGPSFEREAGVLEVLHRESQAKDDASMVDDNEEEVSQQLTGENPKKRKPGKANSFELDDSIEFTKARPKKGASKKRNPLDSDDEDDSFRATESRAKKAAAKKSALDSDDDEDDDDDDDMYRATKSTAKTAPPKKATARRYSSDPEELSDVDDEPVKVAPKPRSKRSAAKRPVKYAFGSDDDEDPIVASDDDGDDAIAEDPRSKRKKPTAGRSKASAKSTKPASSFAARSKKKATGSRRTQFDDSDADEVEYMGSSQIDHLDADWGSAATRSQF